MYAASKVVEESRELGSARGVFSDEGGTTGGAHPDSMLEPGQDHSAHDEEPAIESTLVERNDAWDTREGEQPPSPMNGDDIRDSPTSPQAPEDDGTLLQTAGASSQLPSQAQEVSAVVADTPLWDGAQQPTDDAGWVYDEATASWYAAPTAGTSPGSNGMGDGQSHADQGWRFDEQSATWYQDESVWRGQGSDEQLYIEASEHAAVTSEPPEDRRALGENRVEKALGAPGDEVLLDQGVEGQVRFLWPPT